MFIKNGKQYKLAKIGLVRAACPPELQSTADNRNPFKAILIERNSRHIGRVNGVGFCPAAVVMAGAYLRGRLLDNANVFAYAYIGTDADVKYDGEIRASGLIEKISHALTSRYFPQGMIRGQVWPSIQEIYPFENQFTFMMHASKYNQRFFIDPTSHKAVLIGAALQMNNRIVDRHPEFELQAGTQMVLPVPYLQSTSPMIYQIVKSVSNVDSAVADYLAAIKGGNYTALRPDFCPVQLTADHKIAYPALTSKGIDAIDFARFISMRAETANYHGEKIPVSKVGYVDKSGNAHLPFNTPGRARNALARINQTKAVPGGSKAAVLNKVRRAAKSKGVDVSDEPTSKQKTWKKKSIKSQDSGAPAMTQGELNNTKGLALTI